jgi:DNA-binding NarL/FixJ family response regulator
MPIRVFVVDDSNVFLDAAREVLEASPDFELIGEAHSGEAAIPAVIRLRPDLVLVDVILPGMDGIETCRRLGDMADQPFVILCSVGEDPRAVAGASHTDSSGVPFMPKARISPNALRDAWRARRQVGAAHAHG